MKFPEPRLESRNPSRNLPFARETCHISSFMPGKTRVPLLAPPTRRTAPNGRDHCSRLVSHAMEVALLVPGTGGVEAIPSGRRDGRTTSKTLSGSQLSELHMMENRWKRYEKPLKTMWWFHVRSQLKDCSRIPKRASLTLTATQRPDGSG